MWSSNITESTDDQKYTVGISTTETLAQTIQTNWDKTETGIQIVVTNKEKAAPTIRDSYFFSIPFVAISGKGIFHPEC